MKIVIGALMAAFVAMPVLAQDNPSIDNFNAARFTGCYSGRDIGALTRVSNPLLLLGSLTYVGPVMGDNGQTSQGWVREPLSLPIVTAETTSPDQATCTVKFETVAGGSISFLGLSVNASAGDVYEATVRLISRQTIAPVAEGAVSVSAWRSTRYRDQFRSIVSSVSPTIRDFYLFDNISIYIVDVKRYRRRNGGGILNFGLFSGGVNYDRVDDFNGTKLIVTGDTVSLTRQSFGIPEMLVADTQLAAPEPVSTDRVVQTLTAGQAASVRNNLIAVRQ